MPDSNILTSKRSRGENIIKHPQESYVEVSTRSITKIRSYAASSKKKIKPVLCTILLSLWTTCLGAILGYLPSIYTIIQEKSFEQFSTIYFWIIGICIISFAIWRRLYSKNNHSLSQLIDLIEDELSEDRVPIMYASMQAYDVSPEMLKLEGNNSSYSDALFIAGREQH